MKYKSTKSTLQKMSNIKANNTSKPPRRGISLTKTDNGFQWLQRHAGIWYWLCKKHNWAQVELSVRLGFRCFCLLDFIDYFDYKTYKKNVHLTLDFIKKAKGFASLKYISQGMFLICISCYGIALFIFEVTIFIQAKSLRFNNFVIWWIYYWCLFIVFGIWFKLILLLIIYCLLSMYWLGFKLSKAWISLVLLGNSLFYFMKFSYLFS